MKTLKQLLAEAKDKPLYHHVANIAHKLAKEAHAMKGQNYELKSTWYGDAAKYAHIAAHMKAGDHDRARRVWRNQDTAARDYILSHTPKHTHQALAKHFNFEILH